MASRTLMKKMSTAVAIALAVAACRGKQEEPPAAAPPATSAAAPAGAATGTAGAPTATATVPTQVMVEVVAVDTKAPSITVMPDAMPGATAAEPGQRPRPGEPGTTALGTAGRMADRRTIPVQASAVADLGKLHPGDRVTLLCGDDTSTASPTAATPGPAPGAAASPGTTVGGATAVASPGVGGMTRVPSGSGGVIVTSNDLSECRSVTAIAPRKS